MISLSFNKELLESYYKKYNKREFVHPDPLEFLYLYQDKGNKEIVGLIASTLAFGRVDLILKAIRCLLNKMGDPKSYLIESSSQKIETDFKDFSYRFMDGKTLSKFLITTKELIQDHDYIENFFSLHYKDYHETIIPALSEFAKAFSLCKRKNWCAIPNPDGKSPVKRLNLFLRWMVRKDEVDPGVWEKIPASKLIVPLDIHMWEFAISNKLTKLKSPSLEMAYQITRRFKGICEEDPVKYDFVITRPGIWRNSRSFPKELKDVKDRKED